MLRNHIQSIRITFYVCMYTLIPSKYKLEFHTHLTKIYDEYIINSLQIQILSSFYLKTKERDINKIL